MRIRAARTSELPVLQAIERAAGQPFADIGMVEVTQNEPYPLPVFAASEQAGLLWVTADDAELTPGLRAIRQHEAELGLDRWPRVCMRHDL